MNKYKLCVVIYFFRYCLTSKNRVVSYMANPSLAFLVTRHVGGQGARAYIWQGVSVKTCFYKKRANQIYD